MSSWRWLAIGLAACSGTDSGASDDDDGGENQGFGDDDDTIGPIGPGDVDVDGGCEEIPLFTDLDDLSCEETWTALDIVVTHPNAVACNRRSDCWIAKPDCVNWVQATCFLIVNTCIEYTLIDDYDAAGYGCEGDDGDQCVCPPPPDYDCVDHTCQFVFDE